jgi:hypothetical protein
MEVIGTAKDFGIIDRYYWNTWLVPYGTFRLRVGVTGRDDLWTDWITLRAVRAPRRRRCAPARAGWRGCRWQISSARPCGQGLPVRASARPVRAGHRSVAIFGHKRSGGE